MRCRALLASALFAVLGICYGDSTGQTPDVVPAIERPKFALGSPLQAVSGQEIIVEPATQPAAPAAPLAPATPVAPVAADAPAAPMEPAEPIPAPAKAPTPTGSTGDAALDARIKAQVDRLYTERAKADAALKKQQADEKQKADAAKKLEEDDKGIVVGTVLGLTGAWRNGFWLETPNKDFTFHMMGAVQYDLGLYAPQSNLTDSRNIHNIGPVEDGANLRRGRFRTEGTMWEMIDYRFELEFANGVTPPGAAAVKSDTGFGRLVQQQTFLTPGPTDAWITIKNLPIAGNFRIGNQKEPISLEHLEGFRWLPFMERSPLFDFNTATAFNNGFNPGMMLFDTAFDQRATWAIGVFKNSYDVYGFDVGGGQYAATGRLTWLPYYTDDGQYMVHLGLAGSHRDPVSELDRYRVRPSIRSGPAPSTPFVPFLTDTGFIHMTSQDILALEYFANIGSFTIQAEYMGFFNQDSTTAALGNVGTTFFQGGYVQCLYWLTGEYTHWDRRGAAPDRYNVNNPFYIAPGQNGGWLTGTGAWQAAVRYSFIDSNNRGIDGGMLDDLTVGLNWILNNNVKFQWNYEWSRRYGLANSENGNFNAVGMRMQFDF